MYMSNSLSFNYHYPIPISAEGCTDLHHFGCHIKTVLANLIYFVHFKTKVTKGIQQSTAKHSNYKEKSNNMIKFRIKCTAVTDNIASVLQSVSHSARLHISRTLQLAHLNGLQL